MTLILLLKYTQQTSTMVRFIRNTNNNDDIYVETLSIIILIKEQTSGSLMNFLVYGLVEK